MRSYELMTIHRPELAESDYQKLVEQTEEFLRSRGGTVDKRDFAYEINHLHEGYYSVLNFHAEPDVVDDLDRVLSLADLVVRHKIIRPDE